MVTTGSTRLRDTATASGDRRRRSLRRSTPAVPRLRPRPGATSSRHTTRLPHADVGLRQAMGAADARRTSVHPQSRAPFWVPPGDTDYFETVTIPKLYYERLDEAGIDGLGEAADERGQDRRDGSGGRRHRSNRRWTTRRGAPRYRPQPPPPAPARAAPATPPCSPGRARPCKLQNIDRSRNYSRPCGWSKMWVLIFYGYP